MDLGMVAFFRALKGAPETALELAMEGLAHARRSGTPSAISHVLANLGFVLAGTEPDQARETLRENIQLSEAIGRPDPQTIALLALLTPRRW